MPVTIIVCKLVAWLVAFLRGRIPLPVPELGARIFAKLPAEVKAAVSRGLVASDLVISATSAAAFLRERGCSADVVPDAEPERPIAFVVTNAFSGTVLNFWRHVLHLPRPTPGRGLGVITKR